MTIPVQMRMPTIRVKVALIPEPDQSGGWTLIPVKLSPHCRHDAFMFTLYGSMTLFPAEPQEHAAACTHHLCLERIMKLIQTPAAAQYYPHSTAPSVSTPTTGQLVAVVTSAENMDSKPEDINKRHEF